MADDNERTEAPTPHRRMETRRRGQVAKSQDLGAAVLLLTGLMLMDLTGRGLLARLADLMRSCLSGAQDAPEAAGLMALFWWAMRAAAWSVLPILGVLFAAALAVLLLQVGFLLTADPVKPDFNKLNPVLGFQRLMGKHLLAQLAINLAKLGMVGAVAYLTIASQLKTILFSSALSFLEMVALGSGLVYHLSLRVALALLVLGLIDWLYQRQRHEKSMRMSRQEIKDELRRMDGDPVMKRRRREIQLQLALQNLRRRVPEADVVVTNPTHLAVALKYDARTMAAPRVVAKGEGLIAQRIRALAEEAGVPIVERKPLAKALYRLTEVGREIPEELYKAVAEVLAYVYQLARTRRSAA